MKRTLIVTIIFVFCVYVDAQKYLGFFLPKPETQVKRFEIEYVSPQVSGQNVEWDFTQIERTNRVDSNIRYYIANGCDSIICGKEGGSRSYYCVSGDSLLLCGYENNLKRIHYDQPELLLYSPLTYGNHANGYFHGIASYGEQLYTRIFGTYSVEVDGTGIILLPSGDTLRHVSRVHIHRLSTAKQYPNIVTERQLREFVDSIPYNTDSISCHMTDSCNLVETETYQWYALGYRYPILESVSNGLIGMKPSRTISFYCSPEEQLLLDDPENEQLRNLLAYNEGRGIGNINSRKMNNNNEKDCLDNILQNMNVSVNNSTVNIGYTLLQDAIVTALVCDVSGIVFRQQTQKGQSGDACYMSIFCGGLHHGQYVLYLNVNGKIISQTFSL